MKSHGWTKNDAANNWVTAVDETLSIPTAPFGCVKSRVVTDVDWHTVETFLASPTTKPEQVHRNFKKSRNVRVGMEVYDKMGEELIDWDDRPMDPGEQTRYHALATRLNLLAVDRPDLLYAAKECSRRMSSPRNRNWRHCRGNS